MQAATLSDQGYGRPRDSSAGRYLVVMFFYSGMLILLNTRVLPEPIKLRGWRLVVMWFTFIVFAVLSAYLVYYQIASNFFGVGG